MSEPLFIAVDLGAGSGRVFLVDLGLGRLSLEEIRRFTYPPRKRNGNLRWDLRSIFEEIKTGLKQAGRRASEIGRPVQSLGIDSWAVDYGLLDSYGDLIDDPVCYRDDRTSGAMDEVFANVPRRLIFERTGIQFQNFNTLFQLWSEGEELKNASTILLLPDLINYLLTGTAAAEFTNATTTQLINARSGTWDIGLLDQLDLPASILPNVIAAGTDLGKLKPDVATEVDLPDTHVIAPATHDTASAVAAAPLSNDWAYISSGTWSLIGIETDKPLINDQVERQNFTNEGGVFGTTRFLKNVIGLWIFESCRREWKDRGIEIEYDNVINAVTDRTGYTALICPDDARFLNPPSMLDAIKEQLDETGQAFDDDPISVAKMIFDSLAFRYASVLTSIGSLTGRRLKGVYILGGGGRNSYLDQMTANASSLHVRAGLHEATVIGNAMVQAITAGLFSSIAEARSKVAESVEFFLFIPQTTGLIDTKARYAEIEERFSNSRRSRIGH
jgi:rhamnulokinase